MNFIHQSLIKSLGDFIHFGVVYDNEFLLDARLSEAFQKDFIDIFIFIIEMNTINSIIARFQINLKTQEYDEDLAFITNAINLKVTNEIVFECHKVFIIVEINGS